MEITSLPRDSMEDKEEADAIRAESHASGVFVRMEDVDFAYEEEKWIYRNASFRAEPGEIVALIGPSGQGKTTTLNLVLGLYHPRKGCVRVGNPGGKELRASSSTRCMFSYIPQGNTMFSGTIADNMRMVKPEATDEEIREALEAACAWEFVEKLDQGMDTEVRERGHPVFRGAEAAAVHCESPPCGRAGDDPRRGHQRPGCGDGAAGAAADH